MEVREEEMKAVGARMEAAKVVVARVEAAQVATEEDGMVETMTVVEVAVGEGATGAV